MQLDLPTPASHSQWPWAVATIACVSLALSLTFEIEQIPQQLLDQALHITEERFADSTDETKIELTIDGRDLTLSGTIEATAQRDELVQQLAGIEGMRVVRDELRESDPAEQSRLEALAFQRELALLDSRSIVFEPASTTLAADTGAVLDKLAALLMRYPDTRLRIAGHTDNTGRANVNLRISRERARAVADYLAAAGVDPARLVAQGYGDTQPIADNASPSGRASNRRISFSYID